MSGTATDYDPDIHHDLLRRGLRQLKAAGISPEELRQALLNSPVFKPTNTNCFARSTLERFVREDGKCGKHKALVTLYNFVMSQPALRKKMDIPLSPAAFGNSLMRFLLSAEESGVFKTENALAAFPGKYLMYRPDFAGNRHRRGFFRVSELNIDLRDGALCVAEVQKRPGETPDTQFDEGAFASFGQYAYFLTRQEDKDGTCVKLAVVNKAAPEVRGRKPVQWFQGVMFAASHIDIFPAAKFFCRRRPEGNVPFAVSIKLGKLKDNEAVAYLANPVLSAPLSHPVLKGRK